MPIRADVSAVVTNYNTGPYLERCVESILLQDVGGRRPEVVVVENASFVDQGPHLRAVEAMGAHVLRLSENVGHGAGCNRGLARTSGRFVFFVNSDTRAQPGALAAMVEHLDAHADVAFVEPRTFFDDDLAFQIPESRTPLPGDALFALMTAMSSRFATRRSLAHARRALTGWRASAPIEQAHLTGAFLGFRREVIDELCGFDEAYRLYYEDSDLFARTRRRGLRLVLVPNADVVHYTHRSVAQIWAEAMEKNRRSRARYMRTHHGRIAEIWDSWLERLAVRVGSGVPSPRPAPLDLGVLAAPPTFAGALRGPWLLELAVDPYCAVSAGRVCTEPFFTISPRTWESLYPTTYFMRALALETLLPIAAWRFVRPESVETPRCSAVG